VEVGTEANVLFVLGTHLFGNRTERGRRDRGGERAVHGDRDAIDGWLGWESPGREGDDIWRISFSLDDGSDDHDGLGDGYDGIVMSSATLNAKY
jgi:hypothetical protein